MNLGVATLSAEVRDKTADFLYAKPVSRPMIITQKILAVLSQIILTNLCFAAGTWFIIQMAIRGTSQGTIDFRLYLLLTGTLLLLQIFFVAIGLIVSAFIRRIRTVLPVSMGVVFFFYILYLLNETMKNEKLAFLSPCTYFELARILETEAYELKFVVTFAVLVMVFIGATYGIYMKKDLPSI
jgi:ABC-2 type transport system permease protein